MEGTADVKHWQGGSQAGFCGFGRGNTNGNTNLLGPRHCNSNVLKGRRIQLQTVGRGIFTVAKGTHMLLLNTVRFMHM